MMFRWPALRFDQYLVSLLIVGWIMVIHWQLVPTPLEPLIIPWPAVDAQLRLSGIINPASNSGKLSAVISNLDSRLKPVFPVLDLGPTISATHYLVTEVESGTIMAGRSALTPTYPASTAKLATVLVAKKLYELDRVIKITQPIVVSGTSVGFQVGEMVTVSDLIAACLINSGNDAAELLANQHPAGRAGFLAAMNQLATDLHLKNAKFTNPVGLDDPAQLISAYDLSILAREVIKDPFLSKLVGLPSYQLTDLSGRATHQLINTNQLLTWSNQIKGLKTGTTDLAGQVLITWWQFNQRQFILVVMGSTDRYQDTIKIIEFLTAHFAEQPLAD